MLRMRRKAKRKMRKVLCAAALLAALPVGFFAVKASIPALGGIFGDAAIFSAGLMMPEGGLDLVDRTVRANLHLDDPNGEPLTNHADGEEASSQPPIPSSEPASSQASSSSQAPPADPNVEKGGAVFEKTYQKGTSSQFLNFQNACIKNVTEVSNDTVKGWLGQKPNFTISNTTEPQVLVMHTHATESFEPVERDFYEKGYNARSTDNSKNMVRVGDEIAKQLEAAGIGVVHDATQHDYPSYNGAYERSEVTVKKYLEQYPTIKVVLDIHRDAIESNGTRYSAVAEIGGKKAAQVMIISGCDNGKMNMPNYMENLKFATLLQNQMESDYPSFTRPILFDYRKYNQHLTTGSILIEVGSHGNSLDQAIYAGELVGKSLAKTLKGLM